MRLAGIHHITGFARDGDECINFYTRVLGLRLVKVTVNYDDPSSYHIYFGDHRATPGTLLTFFLWPRAKRQPSESGQIERIGYAMPRGAIAYWKRRLAEHEVACDTIDGDSPALRLRDPDGLAIDLIEQDADHFGHVEPAHGAPVEHAIRAFAGATFSERDPQRIAEALTSIFGMTVLEESSDEIRLALADGGEIRLVKSAGASERMRAMGPGLLHHIAFRASDDQEQMKWRERVMERGLRPTTVRERTYFRSIYFREPGGVLFEIATDGPGMTADEPLESLGERLVLPKWFEPQREEIIAGLPALGSIRVARV